jgi:hypothetical protein
MTCPPPRRPRGPPCEAGGELLARLLRRVEVVDHGRGACAQGNTDRRADPKASTATQSKPRPRLALVPALAGACCSQAGRAPGPTAYEPTGLAVTPEGSNTSSISTPGKLPRSRAKLPSWAGTGVRSDRHPAMREHMRRRARAGWGFLRSPLVLISGPALHDASQPPGLANASISTMPRFLALTSVRGP